MYHVRMAVFPLHDVRDLFSNLALRAAVVDAVVFNNGDLGGDIVQFRTDILLPNAFERRSANAADFFLFRKIQIFFFYGDAFELILQCTLFLTGVLFDGDQFGFFRSRLLLRRFSLIEKIHLPGPVIVPLCRQPWRSAKSM